MADPCGGIYLHGGASKWVELLNDLTRWGPSPSPDSSHRRIKRVQAALLSADTSIPTLRVDSFKENHFSAIFDAVCAS